LGLNETGFTKQRKKLTIWLKISIFILAVVIVLGTVAGFAYWRYIYPTAEIMPGIFAVRTHNNGMPMGNFFLLEADDKYIAIDAGADKTETEKGLLKLGISADDVVAVLITHSHWDHVGSLDLFSNAVIYTGGTQHEIYPEKRHEIILNDEMIRIMGRLVQCFYTPGHTIDSVCYLVDGKYLFAGDLFVTTNDSPFEERYDKDWQLECREKMLELEDVEYIFTGHFGLFKDVEFFRRWF